MYLPFVEVEVPLSQRMVVGMKRSARPGSGAPAGKSGMLYGSNVLWYMNGSYASKGGAPLGTC